VPTITPGDNQSPPWSIPMLYAMVAQCDRDLIVLVSAPVPDLPLCWFGDPRDTCGVSVGTLTYRSRLGGLIVRGTCAACLPAALSVTSADGVAITVTVDPGTRSDGAPTRTLVLAGAR
jgi:hypothetical protein